MHPIFVEKSKKNLYWPYRLLLFCLIIVIVAAAAKPVLVHMGKILELPRSQEKADAVILEGGRLISTFFMNGALQAWKDGQARQIIIIDTPEQNTSEIFGLTGYDSMVRAALDSLNIPDSAYTFVSLKITDPFTRNAALALAPFLQKQNIHSVLLVNDNFHIRRSYLAYKKVFAQYEISVHPYTMEIYLNAENWHKSANGWRRVFGEYIKLFFYKTHGYI